MYRPAPIGVGFAGYPAAAAAACAPNGSERQRHAGFCKHHPRQRAAVQHDGAPVHCAELRLARFVAACSAGPARQRASRPAGTAGAVAIWECASGRRAPHFIGGVQPQRDDIQSRQRCQRPEWQALRPQAPDQQSGSTQHQAIGSGSAGGGRGRFARRWVPARAGAWFVPGGGRACCRCCGRPVRRQCGLDAVRTAMARGPLPPTWIPQTPRQGQRAGVAPVVPARERTRHQRNRRCGYCLLAGKAPDAKTIRNCR